MKSIGVTLQKETLCDIQQSLSSLTFLLTLCLCVVHGYGNDVNLKRKDILFVDIILKTMRVKNLKVYIH